MFYDNIAINTLIQRVGFANAIPPSDIVLSSANLISTSGRTFKKYSSFASVEKLFLLLNNPALTIEGFQAELEEYRKQAVLTVLEKIYDQNLLANQTANGLGYPVNISGNDYSDVIMSRANVFDACIGYQFALDIVHMMMTSSRSNNEERATQLGYVELKVELEGANENSNNAFSGKGLVYELNKAYKAAIQILFPQPKSGLVDRSYLW